MKDTNSIKSEEVSIIWLLVLRLLVGMIFPNLTSTIVVQFPFGQVGLLHD